MNFRPTGVSAELTLGASDSLFTCEIRALVVTPSPEWINTLCPAGTWPDVTWTLDLTYLPGTSGTTDGSDTETTLDDYLYAHYGEQVTFVAWPYGQSVEGYSGLCSIAPGPIGGTQGEWPELGVSLPIYGQPDAVAASTESAAVNVMLAQQQQRRVMANRRTVSTTRRLQW